MNHNERIYSTLLIALIPSSVAALLSFFASLKASNTQIKAIKEQNKADIEKLIEQNKINIEALKEKHTLEMQAKNKEHEHQIEIMQLQHKNELIRNDENTKNKMVGYAITGMMSGLFSNQGPLADIMKEKLQEAIKNKE